MISGNSADGRESPESIAQTTRIRLYIAGATPNSLRAQKNLQAALDIIAKTAKRPSVEIIDVFKGPKRAIADGIFVTPTLVGQLSDKRMVMVGDLSDVAALGSILDATLAEAR